MCIFGRENSEQNGAARDTLDGSLVGQEIEVSTGIGAVYFCEFCHFFRAEASMAT